MKTIKPESVLQLVLVIATLLCINACTPGLMCRVTALDQNPDDITQTDKLITAQKYGLVRERTTTYMNREILIRDYLKNITPTLKETSPSIYIMFWIDQHEFTVDIKNGSGKNDKAVKQEIDSTATAVYNELVSRLGPAKVEKECMPFRPAY